MSNVNTTFKVHRKEKPFTMVDNEIINNNKVSWAAKGVLIYILSKPIGWKIYKKDIVNHATNGVDSVKTILKELKKSGYITLAKVLDNKGRITEWRYNIYEEPIENPIENHYIIQLDNKGNETLENADIPEVENPPLDKKASPAIPEVDFPPVESPQVESPPTSNTKYNNTESSNTQSDQERLSKKEYIKAIKKQIDFAAWEKSAQKQDVQLLNGIIGYMADLCFSKRKQIKINKQLIDTKLVRNDFLNITLDTLLQVLDIIKCQEDIDKPRPYIWTCVYNQIHSDELQDNFPQLLLNKQKYDGSHEPPSYNLEVFKKRAMNIPEL